MQVEDFGMHIGIDGSLMYGMFIEAIMDDDAACIKVDDLGVSLSMYTRTAPRS